MSFFRKKAGIAVIIVIAAAVLNGVISHYSGLNIISETVRFVFMPFQNGVSFIASQIDATVDFIRESAAYKDQNAMLVNQINELKKQNRDTYLYQEENERLLGLLELKESMDQYSTVAARVIGYSPNKWYDKIEINKGTFAGVNVGNTVMTGEGIVGIVTEAGPNWSIVDTILNPESATGITVSRTGDVGVVEGDSQMCYNSQCKLTFVDKDANIIVGDILVTSGTGGIYPAGINVGTIREISADNTGILNYAVVEPMVNFSKLHEVLVINGVMQ